MSRTHPNIVLCHWDGLDLVSDASAELLNSVGTLQNRKPLGDPNDLRAPGLLGEADVILGHWGCPKIDAAFLDRAPNVGLFAYAAGTVKTTVDASAWGRGVRITSGANANAEPVAEFTLGAILLANKDVFWQRDAMRAASLDGDKPRRQPLSRPIGNYNKTIGIVGASIIGRRVIELLKPFPHLHASVYDPFLTDAEATELGVTKMELDDLCEAADILSIHAPELPSTENMIGPTQLAKMRTGATLINTARGRLVDHDALTAEIVSGRLYAMLDVTHPEPLPEDHPLRTAPNVFLTPHTAGTQGTELARMIEYAAEEIRRWSDDQPALNEVTKDQLDRLA